MWFNRFKGAKEFLPDGFHIFENRGNVRRFAAFNTYVEYYNYMQTLPPELRNHFETVEGHKHQKPRFDIDIKPEVLTTIFRPEDILNDLIYNIINYSKELDYDILFKDILLYESHGKEKYSYHVVINNWYHIDHIEAKLFYRGVVNRMKQDTATFVDPAVYSSLQEFRILDNCKSGTTRFKRVIYNHKYYTHTLEKTPVDPIQELEASLLTIIGKNHQHLEIPYSSEKVGNTTNISINNLDIDVPYPFEIDKEVSYGIRLQRMKDDYGKPFAAPCVVCKDMIGDPICHENDNAFLTIEERNVYFRCFRNAKLKYLLKVIGTEPKLKLVLEDSDTRTVDSYISNNTYIFKDQPFDAIYG